MAILSKRSEYRDGGVCFFPFLPFHLPTSLERYNKRPYLGMSRLVSHSSKVLLTLSEITSPFAKNVFHIFAGFLEFVCDDMFE